MPIAKPPQYISNFE